MELEEDELIQLVKDTDMYSGADLRILATEASMMPLRRAMKDPSV